MSEPMTIKDLSQLYWLNKEIEMQESRIRELEAQVLPGAQVMTGMPHATAGGGKLEACAVELADLRSILEESYRKRLVERERLERYIAGIEDSLTRQIFTYRFVEGLPWFKVAQRIGGNNTADSVRMAAWRYIHRK